MGFPLSSLYLVIDYFSHSSLKMCKIDVKRTQDMTFLDCLASTFCDIIGELLPEWACRTFSFRQTSNFADIPVSRVRNFCHNVTESLQTTGFHDDCWRRMVLRVSYSELLLLLLNVQIDDVFQSLRYVFVCRVLCRRWGKWLGVLYTAPRCR